jgi:hypothetical protein
MGALLLTSTGSLAATYTGEAVSAGGVDDGYVGLAPVGGVIEYFIPLAATHAGGTYGVTSAACGTSGAGTCKDYGQGQGYAGADALTMNIFFDTGVIAESGSAQLDLFFRDLDLDPVNDPEDFFESISLSFWNTTINDFEQKGDIIEEVVDLTSDAYLLGTSTNLGPSPNASNDPFTWSLDLATLGILGDLNKSVSEDGGFWIQLGFGSKYTGTGSNTSEYLKATLTVAPVPVPAAVWLFGTALIGFVGMSRRTAVT